MNRLKFVYRMTLSFSKPVWEHYFALRCLPQDTGNQKILTLSSSVTPTDCLDEVRDGFGNKKYVGHCREPHETFGYEVRGTAEVTGMRQMEEPLHPMYRYPSDYTRWGMELEQLSMQLGEREGTNLAEAVRVMGFLYEHFPYAPGVTDIHTTAEEALCIGKGVCQDYAHIMIALLRHRGIPARYVNGMMIGEGATHAWVEIYTGEGWYALDPTNNLHVDDYYIKLAHGRDYKDCVLDKGRFLGDAVQRQEVFVHVERIEKDSDERGNNLL